MNKQQYKLLRKISKTDMYNYTTATRETKEIIHYLAKCSYLVYCSDENDEKQHLCKINQNGKSALYEWKSSKRRWEIPVVISIFAAIGGYREELYQVAELIMTLLK